MKKEYIVNLKGKNYPTYPGVLNEAHEKGLLKIETELIQIPNDGNDNVAIVKAAVRMEDDTVFMEYGDASPKNVNSFIATALIRMAATRAKGRALRDAVNVGDTMLEELPPENDEPFPSKPTYTKPVQANNTSQILKCSDCSVPIQPNVDKFSKSSFGRSLCFDCQEKERNKK